MGDEGVRGAEAGFVHSARRTAVSAPGGPDDHPVSRCSGFRARLPHRLAPDSSTCGTGMDCSSNGIFLRVRELLTESVRHAAVGELATAQGRTMKGPQTRTARSCGAGWPGPCGQGPAGHCTAGAHSVGRAFRAGAGRCDGAWRAGPNRDRGRLARRRSGLRGARCAGSGGFRPETPVGTNSCRASRALREGSVGNRLAHDSCWYREPVDRVTGFDHGHSRDRMRVVLPPVGSGGGQAAGGVRFRRGAA